MYAGSSTPTGWLACDGTAVSRTTYADLFTAIGVTFGGGNGSTTFNLPDMRSRMPIGAGAGTGLTNRTLGGSGGGETKVINSANLPVHVHGFDHSHPSAGSGTETSDHSHGIGYGFTGYAAGGSILASVNGTNPFLSTSTGRSAAHQHSTSAISANTTNGGFANTALDVVNPFLGLNFIIKF
jgi:microcystin-dependent protein